MVNFLFGPVNYLGDIAKFQISFADDEYEAIRPRFKDFLQAAFQLARPDIFLVESK